MNNTDNKKQNDNTGIKDIVIMEDGSKNLTNAGVSNFKDSEFLQMAKEKLCWYTLEASEEEFDEAAVDALVNLVEVLEKRLDDSEASMVEHSEENAIDEKNRAEKMYLERFYEYCDLRAQDGLALEEESISNGTGQCENKKPQKQILFRSKRMAAMVAAACFLLIASVFGTFGVANAGDGNGFFHWLRKDDRGQVIVTDPSYLGIEKSITEKEQYHSLIEVPSVYRKTIDDVSKLNALTGYEFDCLVLYKTPSYQRVSMVFWDNENGKRIEVGYLVYKQEIVIAGEYYDQYEYQYANENGKCELEVFCKQGEKENFEYLLLFYNADKKYFVIGEGDIEELENLALEYMQMVISR